MNYSFLVREQETLFSNSHNSTLRERISENESEGASQRSKGIMTAEGKSGYRYIGALILDRESSNE